MMNTKRTKGRYAALAVVAIILLFSGISFSATLPAYNVLPSLNNLSSPGIFAVSPAGDIYIVESSNNRVSKYNRSGAPAGKINIDNPVSIAINKNNTIYIGSTKDFSVRMLDASGQLTGMLGAGANEFKLPQDISVDPLNNNVYVVDSLDNSVKVYTEAGTFIRRIDDSSNLPVGVTAYNNEIYVLDQPLRATTYAGTDGSNIRGARVQVFTAEGAPSRTFVSYGTGTGQVIRPKGIASDASGRIYITDAWQGVVLCFNGPTGAYLGAIHDQASPMVTPIGVEISSDSRLIVASQNTSSLRIFGLEGYTFMEVTPLSLSFIGKEAMSNPAPQAVTIGNTGTGSLNYTAVENESWMTLQSSTGTLSSNATASLTVAVDTANLLPAIYNGIVTVTDNSGAKEDIKVSLEVKKSPRLSVTPDKLNYSYDLGSTLPATQSVQIQLSDDTSNATVWSATASASWLGVDPSAGTGNSTTQATVTVNPAGLSAGTYMGTISIAANDTIGAPSIISVTLTVKSAGTIAVTTNLAEAGFTITGPGSLSGTGTTWKANGLPVGEYTISYNAVSGYFTPPSETKTVADGIITEFNGDYVIKVVRNILVSPGSSTSQPSIVRVFGADGIMQQETRIAGTKYTLGYNLALGDINGDGVDEIITGLGPDATYAAKVSAADQMGNILAGSAFAAFSNKYGARVATGNFSGEENASIIVGSGPDIRNKAQLRIFVYENSKIADTGVNFIPFSTKYGISVAAGDVDGDGTDELIVAPGPDSAATAQVRVFKVDTSGGLGAWTVSDTGTAFTAFAGKYGANVTTADLNNDGKAEIIVTSGSSKNVDKNRIAAFDGNGRLLGLNIIDNSSGGLEVAAGDIDEDGNAEIVVALGPKSSNKALVKVYRADGTLVRSFYAFTTSTYGARVSIGKIGR